MSTASSAAGEHCGVGVRWARRGRAVGAPFFPTARLHMDNRINHPSKNKLLAFRLDLIVFPQRLNDCLRVVELEA